MLTEMESLYVRPVSRSVTNNKKHALKIGFRSSQQIRRFEWLYFTSKGNLLYIPPAMGYIISDGSKRKAKLVCKDNS